MEKDTFHGFKLGGNTQQFESSRKRLIDLIIEKLTARFEIEEELLRASSVVDLSKWPASINDEPGYLHSLIS